MKKHYSLHSTNSNGKTPSIFISHSSKDDKIVSAFIDRILLLGLGISRQKICYTSGGDTGVKSGNDSKWTILKKLESSDAVIEIITENYKRSDVCLNELGVAWALRKNVIVFTNSHIRPQDVGFIHNTTQLLKIDMEADLFKFLEEHKYLNGGLQVNLFNYHRQVKEFVAVVKRHSSMYSYALSLLRINNIVLMAA